MRLKYNYVDMFDIGIQIFSALGIFLSSTISLWGMLVFDDLVTGMLAILVKWNLIALLVVGMLFILRYQWLTKEVAPAVVNRSLYSACPKWMRNTCYFIMLIGVVVFFSSGLLQHFGVVPVNSGNSIHPTVSGGFGLIAYSAFFAQLYSAKKLYQS